MASTLKEWKDKVVCVVTSDGRIIIGQMVGHDQVQNLILNDAHERVYSPDADVEQAELGLYVIRGDNICVISEFDESKFSNDTREPASGSLPSIHQQVF